MEIEDRVYGKIRIEDPVIEELISTPEFSRLKGVDQAGYYEPYFPGTSHTRFEHSLGVYWLLRQFGATIEEQIAGLLHDVSHSAFSHAIDFVFSEGSEKKQSYQDDYFEEYVLNSSIPAILEKHGFDPDYIINEKNFPLLENNIPDICADRIDYSLRGALAYRTEKPETVADVIGDLVAEDGRWFFRNFDSAMKFSELFRKLNSEHYSSLQTAVMFRRIGDYLKHAISKKYVTKSDLYTTDQGVVEMINVNLGIDPELKRLWLRMNNSEGYKHDPDDYDAEVYCKSRIVDPLCRHEGGLKRVSDIYPGLKEVIQAELKPKGYFVKFLD